jgi:choline dehydrogenase-like flavoprotein
MTNFFRIVDACKTLGLPYSDDLNAPKNPVSCIGRGHFTRDEKQYRNSTGRAFLPADLVRERENLHIVTNAIGGKLVIGQREAATFVEGVEVVDRFSKKKKVVKCGHEVIVCAGALGSPQVLMLSGIGPASHLKEHDIPIYKDLLAVGNNLVCSFRALSTNTVLIWIVARPFCCVDCISSSHEPFSAFL